MENSRRQTEKARLQVLVTDAWKEKVWVERVGAQSGLGHVGQRGRAAPFAAVYSHKFLLRPPLVRDGGHKVFLLGTPHTHTSTHAHTCTCILRQGEYSLSHFIPWWMRPYSSEPQWSQKVGLPYVWILNLCLLLGSWFKRNTRHRTVEEYYTHGSICINKHNLTVPSSSYVRIVL